jgi:hypothetical protein
MTRAFSHRVVAAFTLVEILISIMILALGVLGLGVLFPVVIREQRMGVDASTGIVVANTAKDYLTTPLWGGALKAEPMTALGNGVRITTGNETAYGACCFGSPTPLCLYTTLADCRNRGAPANGAASAAVHAFGPGTTCAASVCRHPAIAYPAVFESGSANRGLENATKWMWQVMRNREALAPGTGPPIPLTATSRSMPRASGSACPIRTPVTRRSATRTLPRWSRRRASSTAPCL